MSRESRWIWAGTVAVVLALGCGPTEPQTAEEAPPADTSPGTVAARVDGEVIDLAALDAWIRDDLFRRATQDGDPLETYSVRRDALQRMVDERLIEAAAQAAGTSVRELVTREISERLAVSDAQVDAFYAEHGEQIGRPLEDVREQVRRHLESQDAPAARDAYLAELRAAHDVEMALAPPRSEVAATGPARGPDDAPVTIVAFSDYQCPFCRRAEPTLAAVLARYPESVRLVHRHYPLDRLHPLARSAAEAAACAEDQGLFWEYHEALFAEGANLETEGLRAIALDLGLDEAEFASCVDERRHQARVEADLAAGKAVGVKGTPAFFVNGVHLNGARPLEDFVQLIDEELAREAGAS